jgi:hypothetical protein
MTQTTLKPRVARARPQRPVKYMFHVELFVTCNVVSSPTPYLSHMHVGGVHKMALLVPFRMLVLGASNRYCLVPYQRRWRVQYRGLKHVAMGFGLSERVRNIERVERLEDELEINSLSYLEN